MANLTDEIAEVLGDRSGDEAWLALKGTTAFSGFDSVDQAVEWVEANCEEPEHYARFLEV